MAAPPLPRVSTLGYGLHMMDGIAGHVKKRDETQRGRKIVQVCVYLIYVIAVVDTMVLSGARKGANRGQVESDIRREKSTWWIIGVLGWAARSGIV